MSWKLFASTFVLIFLAELGDKTQLAAMARAAGSGGARWTVFAAASAALVLSTLIAVLFGSALTRLIPETYIKLAAGALFVVFGVVIIAQVARPQRISAGEVRPGVVSNLVLRAAADFETAAAEDYARLAREAETPAVRAVMEWLAGAERAHVEHIRELAAGEQAQALPAEWLGALPGREALMHDAAAGGSPVVQHALEHEEATAKFYQELSALTPLPALKRAFGALAAEELQHVARLKALQPGA